MSITYDIRNTWNQCPPETSYHLHKALNLVSYLQMCSCVRRMCASIKSVHVSFRNRCNWHLCRDSEHASLFCCHVLFLLYHFQNIYIYNVFILTRSFKNLGKIFGRKNFSPVASFNKLYFLSRRGSCYFTIEFRNWHWKLKLFSFFSHKALISGNGVRPKGRKCDEEITHY